jgi:hypothetical protein
MYLSDIPCLLVRKMYISTYKSYNMSYMSIMGVTPDEFTQRYHNAQVHRENHRKY